MSVPAPDPDLLTRLETFFVSFFHDEPIDDAAILDALRTLDGRRQDRYEYSQAFEDLLDADVEPGYLTAFVRRYANRAATSDEQARDFLIRMRDSTALDDVLEPPDE
jgi:hypothetical protein